MSELEILSDRRRREIQNSAFDGRCFSALVRSVRSMANGKRAGVVHPFGTPDPNKPGDSVIANVISRIASIKG